MLNLTYDFNSLQRKINLFNNLLKKYKINPDTVMVYGSSIGGKLRWESQLDFLIETEKGQELTSWEFEDCNDELSQLLGVKCSVLTNEHLLQSEKDGKINTGTYDSVTKEKLLLKQLLQNLEIMNAIKKNDTDFTKRYLEDRMNNDVNQLLVTDLGLQPILNYAILIDGHLIVDYLSENNSINLSVKGSNNLNAIQCCIAKIIKEHTDPKNINSTNKVDYLTKLILRFLKYLNLEDIEVLNNHKNERLKNIYQQIIKEKSKFEPDISGKNYNNNITLKEIISKSNFEDELKELLKKHGVRVDNTKDLELALVQLAEQFKIKSESNSHYIVKSH